MDATELRSGSTRYRIVGGDLIVDSSANDDTRRVPLASIRHVRLYVAQGRGYCLLTPKSGRVVVVVTPQHPDAATCESYAAFVRELHRHLAKAAPDAVLVAGHGAFFVMNVVCTALVVLYATLFVVALVAGIDISKLATSLPSLVLPMIALASTSKGRPRRYSRGVVPPSFLPAA